MYENEFNGALQAIAESVSEQDFDAIIEGAAILIEENADLNMDEAVQTSAAMLFTEDAIAMESFDVTDAVIDEFASNRPVDWSEAIGIIAESVDADTFDALMTEAVNDVVAMLSEAHDGKFTLADKARWAASTKGGKAAGAVAGAALGGAAVLGGKKLYDKAKEKKAAEAAEAAKFSNRVKAKLEEGKEKASEVVDKAKEKLSPKNEDASEFYTVSDIRAIAESAYSDAARTGAAALKASGDPRGKWYNNDGSITAKGALQAGAIGTARSAALGAGIGAIKGAREVSKLKKAGASEAEIAEAKKNIGKKALKGAAIGGAIGAGANTATTLAHNAAVRRG